MGSLTCRSRTLRGWRTAACLLALLALTCFAPSTAHAEMWESKEHNVELDLEDPDHDWRALPKSAGWAEYDIVYMAETRLDTLKNGDPAQGEGARVDLAVRDLAEGKDAAGVAKEKATRDYLLGRFKTKGSVENATINLGDSENELIAHVLRVQGKANNLGGNESRCVGILVVAAVKAKLYLLRMYAWTTEQDPESLELAIDYFEGNSLSWMDTGSEPASDAPKPPPGEDEDGEDEEELGDPERLEFEEQMLVMVRHPTLTLVEVTREDRKRDVIAKFEDNTQYGSYDFYVHATPIVSGVTPPSVRKMVGLDQYGYFLTNCPEGDVWTYKWPRKPMTPKAKTFLTVPEMGEDLRKLVFGGPRKKKRDPEASAGDLEKLGFLDKPKKKEVGPGMKSKSPVWRAVMGGTTARFGQEIDLKFGWTSNSHVFTIYVRMMRDAYPKWGEGIRSTLESIRMVKKWKTRWPR